MTIKANSLSKLFPGSAKQGGDKIAVDGIDFVVEPGRVTGFLGPNGAGKSTTMRMILGLDAPTSGSVTVNGHAYGESPAPLREVGALLEAGAIHPGRSARDHLRWMAAANGLPHTRVGEVLELVGLDGVAGRRAGGFSLGMRQRLGIAAALLGDPSVVVLDEPVNGLDPEGIRWVRTFARELAAEGRTVFISSHLMSEMAMMADHLIVIGRGRILADCSVPQFMAEHASSHVRVKGPSLGDLGRMIQRAGGDVVLQDDELRVTGLDAAGIGEVAAREGRILHELAPVSSSLEDAFMALTADAVEYHATTELHTLEGAA